MPDLRSRSVLEFSPRDLVLSLRGENTAEKISRTKRARGPCALNYRTLDLNRAVRTCVPHKLSQPSLLTRPFPSYFDALSCSARLKIYAHLEMVFSIRTHNGKINSLVGVTGFAPVVPSRPFRPTRCFRLKLTIASRVGATFYRRGRVLSIANIVYGELSTRRIPPPSMKLAG